MFGHDFYHGTLRRHVIMFGNLFNEMQIKRFDQNNNTIQTINVPIAYGPKQRYIERELGDPTGLRSVSIVLPRMSFVMSSMSYAPIRKLNSTLKYKSNFNATNKEFSSVYAPVPYDMNFTLSCMTKNAEDGIQIVEKIVPFFTPDFTVTVKALPELGVNLDVPIELTNVSSDDSYEGQYEDPRIMTWDLDFIVKGYLFGPVTKSKYITSLEVNTFNDDGNDNFDLDATQLFTGNSNFETSNTIS